MKKKKEKKVYAMNCSTQKLAGRTDFGIGVAEPKSVLSATTPWAERSLPKKRCLRRSKYS